MSKLHLTLCLALPLVSCVAEDADLSQVAQEAKKPGNCGTYGCGQNSPEVEGKLFWTLHERGLYNDQGIRIEKFEKKIGATWVQYRPDVKDGALRGLTSTGAVALSGSQVQYSRFTLWDSKDAIRYYVQVDLQSETGMWSQPNPPWGVQTPTYQLTYWSDKNLARRNLCSAAGTPSTDPNDVMNPFQAVLFDDERIDPESITVKAQERDWFTIGCAGSALAKLHLAGYTSAGSKLVGITTTIDQRTAVLKMITGDYCGNGTAWTFAGMPLHYRDKPGYLNTVVTGEKVEAVWSHQGALCLNQPRIDAHAAQFPLFGSSILDEMTNPAEPWACTPPPPCAVLAYTPGYSYGTGTVLSTNY